MYSTIENQNSSLIEMRKENKQAQSRAMHLLAEVRKQKVRNWIQKVKLSNRIQWRTLLLAL